MAEPYVGEIRMFAGNYAPENWLFCQGQQLSISDYGTLFQVLGTTFGGDGQSSFQLPDLRGRVPIGATGSTQAGQSAGSETVTLTGAQLPLHGHPLNATTSGQVQSPSNALLASVTSSAQSPQFYGPTPAGIALTPSIGVAGANQSHPNIQPYLCIGFIIAVYGEFPSPA